MSLILCKCPAQIHVSLDEDKSGHLIPHGDLIKFQLQFNCVSHLGGRSALTIILEGNKNEHLDMLKGGVIQKLLEEKWKTFGHVIILLKFFLFLR